MDRNDEKRNYLIAAVGSALSFSAFSISRAHSLTSFGPFVRDLVAVSIRAATSSVAPLSFDSRSDNSVPPRRGTPSRRFSLGIVLFPRAQSRNELARKGDNLSDDVSPSSCGIRGVFPSPVS